MTGREADRKRKQGGGKKHVVQGRGGAPPVSMPRKREKKTSKRRGRGKVGFPRKKK